MYYTYKYIRKDKQINMDQVLNCLYSDTDYIDNERVNAVYQDLSYDRYRTLNIAPNTLTQVQCDMTNHHIQNIIDITFDIKNWLAHNQDNIKYKVFEIPKATGGFRTIKAPEDTLKEFMQSIKQRLEHIGILTHDSAYAYVKERDCKKAIQRHQAHNSNWFLKLDISKFFNHCTPDFIKLQLKQIYPFTLMEDTWYNDFIETLCKLACLDNELPQGTPLSPLITNWLMIPIDYQINKTLYALNDYFYTYTRYADDMLISSRNKFDANKVTSLIKTILKEQNTPFEIKNEKTRFGSKAGRNWNLGIMYNKDNNLTVGYKRKRRIKAMLFQFYQGRREYQFLMELNGELAYLKNIEQEYYVGMLLQMNQKYNFKFKEQINKAIKES